MGRPNGLSKTGRGQCKRRMRRSAVTCGVAILVGQLLLFWTARPAAGQVPRVINPSTSAQLDELLTQRGDLTLRDVSLAEALFSISEIWNVNLVFGKDVDGKVNGVFRDAPLQDVLDTLLISNGYGYRPKGRSLVIMKLDELGDSNAMFQSLSIPLNGNVSDDLIEGAKLFLSPQGKIQPINSANSLLIIDFPDRLEKVSQFLASIRQNDPGPNVSPGSPIVGPLLPSQQQTSQVAYLSPQHTKAESLKAAVQSVISASGKVTVIADENRLVIVDDPASIDLARKAVGQLDVPRPQVRITALIYDLDLEEMEKLGVNWSHTNQSHFVNGVPQNVFGIDSTTLTQPTTVVDAGAAAGTALLNSAAGGALSFTTLHKNFQLSSIINLLDSTKGARLLADPTVTVVDREQASIKIVTEVPFQQLTQTTQGGNIGTTSFREAGVTLMVTPQIADDGTIKMKVSPSFSVLTGFSEGQPIIDSREADTTVRVANGQTLVIGGLRQRTENETVTGLPGLMHIKYIGKLFRSHETTIKESELIVFLKPEVITPNSFGTAREVTAYHHGQGALERLPAPVDEPFVPYCKDKHCPYHHPRPRTGSHEPSPSNGTSYPAHVEEVPEPVYRSHLGDSSVGTHSSTESVATVVYARPTSSAVKSGANGEGSAEKKPSSVGRHRSSGRCRCHPAESASTKSTTDWFKGFFGR